jgi:alanine racemase
VSTPLLVLGYTRSKNILNSPFADVAFSVGSVEQLAELTGAADTDITLHIKVDTGMHRQGIAPGELAAAVSACRANAHLAIGGVCSHLADADGSDAAFTQRQIQTWNAFVQEWRKQMPEPKWLHLSATKGVRYKTEIDANVVRLGIGLYGIDPLGEMQELRPALELRTEVTAVRDIAVGESVGYNHTWRATRKTRVATIPAGYFEGVDRGLSNKGFVDVCGVPCPIVGRVSMNMTSADVTDVPDVRVGSPVVVVSADPTRKNSVVSLAALCDTIPYVILVHISPLLRRTVV